jgi:amino acid permease
MLTFGHVNLAEVYMYVFVLLTCFGVSAAYVVFIATTAPHFIPGARSVSDPIAKRSRFSRVARLHHLGCCTMEPIS